MPRPSWKRRTFLWILWTFVPAAYARDYSAIKSAGTVKIATEGAFRPFNYYEGKKLAGFEIELAELLAQKMGLKTDWAAQAFDSLLIGLSQDRYDFVIASHGITEDRQKAVDFADPHYCTGGAIVSHADGPKTKADLKGKTVAVQVGTSYSADVGKIPGVAKMQTFPKDPDAFQALTMGRVDAWVTDKFTALDFLSQHPDAKLRLGDLLFSEKVGMAVGKGNDSLRKELNKAPAQVMKDGSYKKLSMKFFHQDIRCGK